MSDGPDGREPAGSTAGSIARTPSGEAWVYESIVGAIPGVRVSRRVALAVQFGGFEAAVLIVGWLVGVPIQAIVAGTLAVGVASVGSAAMSTIATAVRESEAPATYRHVLLGTRMELVLGLLAFAGLVTYLFVVDPRRPPVLLSSLFGGPPPAPAAYLLLLVAWDVCYRIGAAWWASVTALWRSRRWSIGEQSAEAVYRADRATLAFGLLQLALVPVVVDHPFLLVALVGHVAAVVVVTTAALATR